MKRQKRMLIAVMGAVCLMAQPALAAGVNDGAERMVLEKQDWVNVGLGQYGCRILKMPCRRLRWKRGVRLRRGQPVRKAAAKRFRRQRYRKVAERRLRKHLARRQTARQFREQHRSSRAAVIRARQQHRDRRAVRHRQ